ncbi:MAG: TonB-dependent receptor [Bacteroidales bacterium]|nr:TonB-dependent receptor [Bacteroidales bacterium]
MTRLLIAVMLLVSPPDSVKTAQNDSTKTLQTVSVSARSVQAKTNTQNSVEVDATYLEEHFAGSLMQSLEAIPGIKAVAIGAGLSKPTIRGLGYNRMVVSEDGIKHEGQQWGDDHGLEVDQFAVDAVEVVKGPATLLYGSDAIGGVLALAGNRLPAAPLEASATLFGRSNNMQGGLSAHVAGRRGGFFYKANLTLSDYGDYRVPADSIQYYSYWIRLHDGHLRNTAGTERDARLMLGWTNNENLRTDLTVSDVYARSGFFADAHGMEVRLSGIDYDCSRRDVDLPSQWVNHLKVQSHSTLLLGVASLEANLAWQHNLREEMSEPLSHGFMPTPPDSLERRFDKHTFSGTLGLRLPLGERHELRLGTAAEHQHNRRNGWGFIIPDFESTTFGLYATDQWTASEALTLNGGLRYDAAHTAMHAYSDWYLTPTTGSDSAFLQRASEARRDFGSLTWSLGANWHSGNWILRLNVGKAFRVPVAKELGANGVNYHIFRYEQGNADLDPERSYQLDAGMEWNGGNVTVKVDPYFNYFPNYIYLNPTADYVEGLQLYRYTQTSALRFGLEAEAAWRIDTHWEAALRGQFCHSQQTSGDKRGYTLPFAVPPSTDLDVTWHYDLHGCGNLGLNIHAVAPQDEIVPPEKPTPGFLTLNLSASHRFDLHGGTLAVALQLNNLLDARYYDHTSYYRLIDIPEPGRNLSLRIKYEFKKQQKEPEL